MFQPSQFSKILCPANTILLAAVLATLVGSGPVMNAVIIGLDNRTTLTYSWLVSTGR